MAGTLPNPVPKDWTPIASPALRKQAEVLATHNRRETMTRYDPLTNTRREFTVMRPPTTQEALGSGAFSKPGAVTGKMTTRSSTKPKGGRSKRSRKQKRTPRKQRK